MKTRKTSFEKPLAGVGKVTLGEKTFTINLTYRTGKGDETETEKLTFKYSDLPEGLPDGWELKTGKEYFASASHDGTKLLNIRPAKGTFQVRCVSFSENRNDSGDYLVVVRDGEYGKYSQFVPLLTVQKGPHTGIDFPIYLPYGSEGRTPRLGCDDNGLMTLDGDVTKSRGIALLQDFLIYTGVYEEDIQYPMDGDEPDYDPQAVLRVLHKAVKRAKQDFIVLVENGYPKSLAELEDEPEPSDEADTVSDEDEKEPVTERKAVKEEAGPYSKSKRQWDDED